jgi:hypothetical protein
MNFEDPNVFQRMTGPEYKKYWKETYGYDWINQEKSRGMLSKFIDNCAKSYFFAGYRENTVFTIEYTELMKHCAISENRKTMRYTFIFKE